MRALWTDVIADLEQPGAHPLNSGYHISLAEAYLNRASAAANDFDAQADMRQALTHNLSAYRIEPSPVVLAALTDTLVSGAEITMARQDDSSCFAGLFETPPMSTAISTFPDQDFALENYEFKRARAMARYCIRETSNVGCRRSHRRLLAGLLSLANLEDGMRDPAEVIELARDLAVSPGTTDDKLARPNIFGRAIYNLRRNGERDRALALMRELIETEDADAPGESPPMLRARAYARLNAADNMARGVHVARGDSRYLRGYPEATFSGLGYAERGDLEFATQFYNEAAALLARIPNARRQEGDRNDESYAHFEAGFVYTHLGSAAQARASFDRSLDVLRLAARAGLSARWLDRRREDAQEWIRGLNRFISQGRADPPAGARSQ